MRDPRRPGRPPLDEAAPSTGVHLKLPTTDYDRLFAMAKAEKITIPQLIRDAIEAGRLVDQDNDLTSQQAFRIVRMRRMAEHEATLNSQQSARSRRHAKRLRRLRCGFVEKVRRSVVYKRHGGICGICKLPVDFALFQVDHVIPLAKGGQHSYANTQPAHPRCNAKKAAHLGFSLDGGAS